MTSHLAAPVTEGADPLRAWLPMRPRVSAADFPLFCIPHAGGGASAFGSWLGRIPGVGVLAVQPPGRESRIAETPHRVIEPLVADMAGVVATAAQGRPFAIYGHSHGALLGFEVVRELRRRGGPLPVHLVVSGCPAPHTRNIEPAVSRMSRPELVKFLRKLGGTPEWLLADPGALDMILPPFVADFAVRENYRYRDEPALPVPLTVLAAVKDGRASMGKQQRWADLTTGAFRLHTMPGGHFAVYEDAATTHRLLAGALGPALAGLR
ncbi:alpha/beta fold hydrolase [Nakamurella sp. YIM 132087]|uniref:Alpha/beta fold hydrolase n=1 Tax=Nakamurella alba TaxID=2665158 RepID=A0A7K1FMK2_9ACTN|nr:thioesterase domain-containing protein [Nakamurella alba]MTD15348.1 alpha/beta fold hydrolase [Nakamurella alba]